MFVIFEDIIYRIFNSKEGENSLSIFDPALQFEEHPDGSLQTVRALNAAFLISLSGKKHADAKRAEIFLNTMKSSPMWKELASFYLSGKYLISKEIEKVCKFDPDFKSRLENLQECLINLEDIDHDSAIEKLWSVFFPEGTGILKKRKEMVRQVREKRKVKITQLNPFPLADPGRQLLFTSNVLLTVPDESTNPDELPFSCELRDAIKKASLETQSYWFDHPVQIGVSQENNEILYGLRGLDETAEFERAKGNLPGEKLTCILSVSVTHRGLQNIAKKYIEEISRSEKFRNLRIYVFTEADTNLVLKDILVPAAMHYLKSAYAVELLDIFGVDGEYGRHYSFLKAIAAFWNILINPEIKATFKIDLDQVFPQRELVDQTNLSAFEHFKTDLWGARGIDSQGHEVELGMIAGALVNENDIAGSLFTPDVVFPDRKLSFEERIFFSTLPQALSTESGMMTRYEGNDLDGKKTCIQRVHVTGGTNGILVDSLRQYRPFTPSFIGRAEDQAYILSVLSGGSQKLAYVHKDGLIMRHDKDSFAMGAIKAASIGKLVGDYIRTLFFSEYARVLNKDVQKLKNIVDPFTGCFISKIPTTVVFLRFSLKAASFFSSGNDDEGFQFIVKGVPRIKKSLDFIDGENSLLRQSYEKERAGWDLYFDTLSAIENGLKKDDPFSINIRGKARDIVKQGLITNNI